MFVGCIWAVTLVLHRLVHAAFPGESDARRRAGPAALPLVALVVLLLPTSFCYSIWSSTCRSPNVGIQLRVRNFFGTLAVREKDADDPKLSSMFLYHGITTHGSQFTDPSRRGQPTTYYSTLSGVGRTLNFFRRHPELGSLKVGVVGLGTGTVAAYIGGGDSIAFYEINPAVIEITESGRWFTYLQDCRARGGNYQIKLGDARLTLERELRAGRPQRFHVLVLDAFSGDAIPVHLLTEEAFDVYVRHLSTPAAGGAARRPRRACHRTAISTWSRSCAARRSDLGYPMARIHSPRIRTRAFMRPNGSFSRETNHSWKRSRPSPSRPTSRPSLPFCGPTTAATYSTSSNSAALTGYSERVRKLNV